MSKKSIQVDQKSWIHSFTSLLAKWGWFIALAVIVATAATFLIPDRTAPPLYRATLQIQPHLTPEIDSTKASNNVILSYANYFVDPSILKQILPRSKYRHLSELQAAVSATPLPGAHVIQLSALGSTPDEASELVHNVYLTALSTISSQRLEIIQNLTLLLTRALHENKRSEQHAYQRLQALKQVHAVNTSVYLEEFNRYERYQQYSMTLSEQIFQLQRQRINSDTLLKPLNAIPEVTALSNVFPTILPRMILAPLLGLIMGTGGIFLVHIFRTKQLFHRNKRLDTLPHTMARIPALPLQHQTHQQTLKQFSPCTSLLRHLQYQAREHERALTIISVTSPGRREGKSLVASALALAAAKSGLQTLLVDIHAHYPTLHLWFQTTNSFGTLDAIQTLMQGEIGSLPIATTNQERLGLISIGNCALASYPQDKIFPVYGLRLFLELLRKQADLVILDGPALLDSTNALHLAQLSDITLLVVDNQYSRSTSIVEAKQLLSTLNIPCATVRNRANHVIFPDRATELDPTP